MSLKPKDAVSILAFIAGTIAGANCHAQATTAAALPQSAVELQTVVVTAEKRTESVKNVPMSISVLSADDMAKHDVKDAVALSFAVPSLGAYPVSPGEDTLEIRGVSNFRGDQSLVGVYMDDIPLTGVLQLGNGSGLDAQTMDLARIEVLKGPQGTLFGQGSMGGVIRYVTNDPDLAQVKGRATATYFNTDGGADSEEFTGVLNLPVIDDKLGVRFAGTYQRDGGWIDNVGTGKRNFNSDGLSEGRAKILFRPTAKLAVSALIDIHRLDYGGQNIVNVLPYSSSEFRQAVYPDTPTNGYNNFNLYNLTASYNLGFATLLSSTSHYDLDVSNCCSWQTQVIPGAGVVPGGGYEVLQNEGPHSEAMTSEELRLTSNPAGPLKWVVGGDFTSTRNEPTTFDYDFTNLLLIPPSQIVRHTVPLNRLTSSAIAEFADASYTFFKHLEIGGGLRYFTDDEHEYVLTTIGTTTQTLAGTFDKMTYRAYARYDVNDDINLYVNKATGFRSGAFNIDIPAGYPQTVSPETSTFYEEGVKGRFLERRLGVNVAAYQGQYANQVQDTVSLDPVTGSLTQYGVNAGEADIRGFEWEVNAIPLRGLRLGFSGDVTTTRFEKVTPLAPVKVGDPMDFVPRYDFMLSADYEFEWTPSLPGFVNVSSSWKGRMQNTNRNSGLGYVINVTEPLNFVQVSTGIEYRTYEISLFCRNLTNDLGILQAQFTGITPQGRPRTIGLTVSKAF